MSAKFGIAIAALCVTFLLATGVAFWVPPAQNFQAPDAARIIFWHVPFAVLSQVGLFAAAWFGGRFLMKGQARDGARLLAAWEISTLFALIALSTGIPFSKVQWGDWWHWDPRQTSFLLVTALLVGGWVLAKGHSNRTKRRQALGAYAVLTFVPAFFLTFVFTRLPQVKAMSLHPSTTIAEGGLDSNYRLGLYLMGVAALLFGILCIGLRSRLDLLEENTESLENGDLENHRHHPAGSRGVRPVVLPTDSGETPERS